jgi:hypothetical protein
MLIHKLLTTQLKQVVRQLDKELHHLQRLFFLLVTYLIHTLLSHGELTNLVRQSFGAEIV